MNTPNLPLQEDLWISMFARCLVHRHEHSAAVGASVAARVFPSLGQLSPLAALDLLERESMLLGALIAHTRDAEPLSQPAQGQAPH